MTWRICARHPNYEISASGLIRRRTPGPSTWPGRRLTPCPNDMGYLYVCIDSERETIHALVCETWHGARPTPEHEAAHRNGNNQDNRWRNLAWLTKAENGADRSRHGRVKGSKNPSAKLDEVKVARMKKMLRKTDDQQIVAAKFGVTSSMVSRIALGLNWAHVKAAA